MSKMSKKGLVLFKFVLVAVLVFGYTFYIYPVTYFQKLESLYLFTQGVRFKQTEHFDYFEKNNCISGKKCQCVLLVHGLGDFAYTWSQTLASGDLKNSHLFAVNLPGSLASPKLSGVEPETYAFSHLTNLLQTEVLPMCETWAVAGNSYGGWLSLKLAEADSRVQKVMLISPAGLKKNYQHILDYFLRPNVESARDFYHKAYFKTYPVPTFIFEAIVRRSQTQPVIDMLKAVRDGDYIQKPLNLKRPVEILWGENDLVLPVDWAPEYQKFLVGARLKIVNKCGHLPQKECFTEFQKELVSFLKID